MERGSYRAKASDEPPVEVIKPKELLNVLAAIRCGPKNRSKGVKEKASPSYWATTH